MLRVALNHMDLQGCGHSRILYPAAAITAAGDVEIEILKIGRVPANRLAREHSTDVVVFQRPTHRRSLEKITHLQAAGIAVVIDVDDDLFSADPRTPAFNLLHPSTNTDENISHLRSACRLADMVTVTTPQLAARFGPKAVVIPNCVPKRMLDVRVERDGHTVGWAGSTRTHIGDLAETAGGVAQAIEDVDGRFLLVGGDTEDVQRQLGLQQFAETLDWVDIDSYPAAVARFDVGIVPLRTTAFNRAKSALKGLEYAALGVPFVASPLPEYERLYLEGIGAMATRGKDWRRQIRHLLASPNARVEMRDRARTIVAERHTYERNAHLWCEAWELALERRHHAAKPVAA